MSEQQDSHPDSSNPSPQDPHDPADQVGGSTPFEVSDPIPPMEDPPLRPRSSSAGEDSSTPVDEPPPGNQVSDHHPTGSPEKPGGWMAGDFPVADESPSPDDLPEPTTETDVDATRVTPAAFSPVSAEGEQAPGGRWRGCSGCALRMLVLALFIFAAVVIGALSFGLFQYYSLTSNLPPVDDLEGQAAQFETTRILDREGNLLYELLDPQAGRRTYVPLEEISPYMIAAIIATEDSQFYSHPGFDLWAIARAMWQNYTSGEVVSGASTITQQITRNLLFTPEERMRITARRKTREILLAQEITRRYSKEQILELYLNQSYFGNLAYGVEAAAETYFDTTADRLTLAQASFLAGLVQAPSVYDVFTNPEATLDRHRQVLTLMVDTSSEQGCIYVSDTQQPICVTPEMAGAAAAEITNYEFHSPAVFMRYPHWVTYIRSELESLFDPQTIYRSGFTVRTTLDPFLQDEAQRTVREQVAALVDNNASNGALVAIDPETGEILAMVGSADFYNEEIDGQVNMALAPRQPGSALKPLTYTAAFEKGWTPATLIWDVPSEFPPSGNPNDPRPPYEPVNYDEKFHGPVTVRSALANSYNVPAVKTLDFVGIYDDESTPEQDGLISFASRLGISTLTRDDYGLALTLGGGDVSLLELTSAYSTYANEGSRIPPTVILSIEDYAGNVVYEYEVPEGEQVLRPEHAFLITDILSDNTARTPAFGPNSSLRLPFPAAAKTGTTNDFRDNWTLGFTPDFAIGVWVGNADYTPMQNTSGLTGAAPIWNDMMQVAADHLTNGQPRPFRIPSGIDDHVICSISGTVPSEWCPSQRTEMFAFDQPPLPKEQDLWRELWIDTYSLEAASAECPDYVEEKLGLNIDDPWARKWLEEDDEGQKWAEDMGFDDDELFFIPEEVCSSQSPRPILAFTDPSPGSTISQSPLSIFGQAAGTDDFEGWKLEYGIGDSPRDWPNIVVKDSPVKQVGKLAEWDFSDLPEGRTILRLTVRSKRGGLARITLPLNIRFPTPTHSPTPSTTATPTNTLTPSPTQIPSVTPTPSLTPSPTETPTITPTLP